MAISSILKQISYWFNTNFLLINFASVKKKNKSKGGGGAIASPVMQGNCRAHLIHMVTKHKSGIETGDIHIFEQIISVQKRMQKESLTAKQA